MEKVTSSRLGDAGENVACKFLKANGFEVITTNYHSRYGEVDIIAKTDETYVFIEVKTRSKMSFADVLEQIPKSKFEKIHQTALIYLQENSISDCDFRIDLIALLKHKDHFSLNHIENAYELN